MSREGRWLRSGSCRSRPRSDEGTGTSALDPRLSGRDSERAGDVLLTRFDAAALVPVVRGQQPLYVVAERAADIREVLKLTRDFPNLDLVILGASEGWMAARDIAAAGVPVIGISRDKPAKLKKFSEKYGLSVILASDEPGDACAAFGTWVEKSLYGRTYMGIERATFLFGAQGKVQRIWRKVKVKGHAEEVLAAAQVL